MTDWLAISAVPVPEGERDWSALKERAARLQAESGLGTDAVAAEVGISPATLWRWNKLLEFRERVREINADLDVEAYRTVLARKRNRVVKLADMANHVEGCIRRSRKPSPSLIREWRGLYEQIARELGQWQDKLELSGGLEVRRLVVTEVEIVLSDMKEEDDGSIEATFTEVDWT